MPRYFNALTDWPIRLPYFRHLPSIFILNILLILETEIEFGDWSNEVCVFVLWCRLYAIYCKGNTTKYRTSSKHNVLRPTGTPR